MWRGSVSFPRSRRECRTYGYLELAAAGCPHWSGHCDLGASALGGLCCFGSEPGMTSGIAAWDPSIAELFLVCVWGRGVAQGRQ